MLEPWQKRIDQFRSYLLLERRLSAHTVEAYLADVGKLAFFIEQQAATHAPEQVKEGQLSEFLQWLGSLGLGESSQARILSGLRAFYKYLLMEELIELDPTEVLEGPRLRRKIPEVLTLEEIQLMLESIDLSHPQGHRNRAMLEVLYACGLRVSELIHLRISHLFLEVGFIKVLGKNNKERLVPLGGEAVKYIEFYRKHDRNRLNIQRGEEDFLFLNRRGRRLTRVMVFHIVRAAAREAGIEKTVSPHTFRHSFATHLVEGGADLKAVQDMLGHESITTTEIYTHLNMEYLRETLMRFHPRGGSL